MNLPVNILFLNVNSNSHILHSYREILNNFLQAIRQTYPNIGGNDNDYSWDRGLNCNYGIELEFYHINNDQKTSRYVLGNKINNCIFNQNHEFFYKFNFNPMSQDTILTQQLTHIYPNPQPNAITRDQNFGQWTNAMTEVMSEYHASTHNGATMNNTNHRGMSGFKIEKDGGVILSSMGPADQNNGFYPQANLAGHLNNHNKIAVWKRQPHAIIDGMTRTINSGTTQLNIVDVHDFFNAYNTTFCYQTELVSPILKDEQFLLPNDSGDLQPFPWGSILMNNMIEHMKSHNSTLFVQNDGLHIHISKNRANNIALNNGSHNITPVEAVGFAKLFWLFEPLFVSGEPRYRSDNNVGGYQSIQSLFTYGELKNQNITDIYNVLTSNVGLPGRANRRERNGAGNLAGALHEARYLSLNFCNLVGGIGTIEYRIGHGTFDGKAIQLHTHLLQVLFQFNLSLISIAPAANPHSFIDHILDIGYNFGGIPYYCCTTSTIYDTVPPNQTFISNSNNKFFPQNMPPLAANLGRPLYGFFNSCYGKQHRTKIISTLANLFISLTGADAGIRSLTDYINLYHNDAIVPAPLRADFSAYPGFNTNAGGGDLEPIDVNPFIAAYSTYATGAWQTTPGPGNPGNAVPSNDPTVGIRYFSNTRLLRFNPYEMFTNYSPAPGLHNLTHASRSCSLSDTGAPSLSYNNGDQLVWADIHPRKTRRHYSEQRRLFRDQVNQGAELNNIGKLQSELLNSKIKPGFTGGKTRRHKIEKVTKRKMKGGDIEHMIFPHEEMLVHPSTWKFKKLPNLSIVPPIIKEITYKTTIDKPVPPIKINVNRYLDQYDISIQSDKIILSYPIKFSEKQIIDEQLSKVANQLIHKKIITQDQLFMLVELNYIEPSLYLDEPSLFDELKQIKQLNITSELFEKIKSEYLSVYKL